MITLAPPWTNREQRRIFRQLLAATAQPGTVRGLAADLGGLPAAVAVTAVLADAATTLADPGDLLVDGDRARIGARMTALAQADFVLLDGAEPPPETAPRCGSLLSPELGATVILACTALGGGLRLRLSGPGIVGGNILLVAGIHPGWWPARNHWCEAFPCGVDLLLCDRESVAAIPRSTRLEAA